MRAYPEPVLEKARRQHPAFEVTKPGQMFGYFSIRGLDIISSGHCEEGDDTGGWEHVSVSLPKRTPTWQEMCYVKSLFFYDHETVIQFHPRKSNYVNVHENCLHLWKKAGVDHELPPTGCV